MADIYHSDNIDRVSDDFIASAGIKAGNFDNVAAAKYAVPSHWDIGKVYKRLILGISREKNMDIVDALFAAYNSFVSDKIDDYNSSFYYDAPTEHSECVSLWGNRVGKPLILSLPRYI